MIRFYRSPKILEMLYPTLIWEIKAKQKEIFLTFDDGPNSQTTNIILNLLANYDAKASWFCLGKNIEKLPYEIERIKSSGHFIGNHTYSHVSGWGTSSDRYNSEILKCDCLLEKHDIHNADFRPPYGRLRPSQVKKLHNKKVYMWSHNSYDFDKKLNLKESVKSLKTAQAGSILLFHDKVDSIKNTEYLLQIILEYFSKKDFKFSALSK